MSPVSRVIALWTGVESFFLKKISFGLRLRSEGCVRVVDKRPAEPQDQRLERHRDQGTALARPSLRPVLIALLQIDPNRRHVDKSTVAHFWKMLDTWTTQNKPSLMMA